MRKKIIAGVVVTTILATGIASNTFASTGNIDSKEKNFLKKDLTEEQKAEFEKIKPLLDKKRNGEKLTTEEENLLKNFKPKFGKHPKKELTEEQKAEFEKIKPLLDKKRNGEKLTTEEENLLKNFKAK